jgi:hypothetical protein
MNPTTAITTLNEESILAFARTLCPKLSSILTVGDAHNPFLFSTARGARVIAPVFHYGNRFGFRSFLQVTGKNPTYLCNGQAGKGTKSLMFFGEGGPAITYRHSSMETASVWGITSIKSAKHKDDLLKCLTYQEAITYVANSFPGGFPKTSALSAILATQRIPVTEGVPLILDLLPFPEGLQPLRMFYKVNHGLLQVLQARGLDLSKCLYEWRNCEYPQSVARELLRAGIPSDTVLTMLQRAYADSTTYVWSDYRSHVLELTQAAPTTSTT